MQTIDSISFFFLIRKAERGREGQRKRETERHTETETEKSKRGELQGRIRKKTGEVRKKHTGYC